MNRIPSLLPKLLLVVSLIAGPALAEEVELGPDHRLVLRTVTFTSAGAAIDPGQNGTLQALGEFLKAHPDLFIEIGGHSEKKGNEAENKRLSEKRAASIKEFLVSQYGIWEERVKVKGFGSANPVSDNDTDEGRALNRRVEVVGLTTLSARPIADGQNKPVNFEARLTAAEKKVEAHASWDTAFRPVRVNEPIYEYTGINTGSEARAELTFRDTEKVQLLDDGKLFVHGWPVGGQKATAKGHLELTKGTLLTQLDTVTGDRELDIAAGAGHVFLQKARARVAVDGNDKLTVAVFEGRAKVEMEGKAVELNAGQGTVARKGSAPEAPSALAPAPIALLPTENGTPATRDVKISWVRSAKRSRLEVARDANFNATVFAKLVDGESQVVSLDGGTFFWRVSGVDEDGLDTKATAGRRFTVGGKAGSTSTPAVAVVTPEPTKPTTTTASPAANPNTATATKPESKPSKPESKPSKPEPKSSGFSSANSSAARSGSGVEGMLGHYGTEGGLVQSVEAPMNGRVHLLVGLVPLTTVNALQSGSGGHVHVRGTYEINDHVRAAITGRAGGFWFNHGAYPFGVQGFVPNLLVDVGADYKFLQVFGVDLFAEGAVGAQWFSIARTGHTQLEAYGPFTPSVGIGGRGAFLGKSGEVLLRGRLFTGGSPIAGTVELVVSALLF